MRARLGHGLSIEAPREGSRGGHWERNVGSGPYVGHVRPYRR